MRTLMLALVTAAGLGLAATAVADGKLTQTVATASDQPSVWQQRELRHSSYPLVVNSETMGLREVSCDQLYDTVHTLLKQLGATHIKVDQRPCQSYSSVRSVDVSFSVLTPVDAGANHAAKPVVDGHWETLALKGNCTYLQYATKKILPLFTTRNVKLIPDADCAKLGIGLYAEVLKAAAPSDE